ncbi:hypothetical protein KI387_000863, partial [Taxus chinensis]
MRILGSIKEEEDTKAIKWEDIRTIKEAAIRIIKEEIMGTKAIKRKDLLLVTGVEKKVMLRDNAQNHNLIIVTFVTSKTLVPFRSISTSSLKNSWLDKIKGYIPGLKKKELQPAAAPSASPSATPSTTPSAPSSFSLDNYADELQRARKMGNLAQFVKGRGSEVTMSQAIEKQEAIIRVLATYDLTGEHLEAKHKADAAKRCNCTMVDVENALSKFTWAKAAQKKIDKLKEEGKPMPKSLAEVQQLIGSSPIDIANSSLAKSGQISRNANCPCGSKKKFK